MAFSVTHTTVATGTDSGDGKISKNAWNEALTATMATNKTLGRITGGTGAVEELDLGLVSSYSGTSEPSAPAAGLTFFSQDRNGWPVPYARGAAQRSGALFPYHTGRPLFGRAVAKSGASSADVDGLSVTASNALAVGIANTNSYTRFARMGLNTTATGSASSQLREATTPVFARGTNTFDGFRVIFRFGVETVGNTNCRWFVGLLNSTTATNQNFDPVTAGQIEIGIGATSTDTANMKLYYNDNAGAPSTVDLGANYPAKTAQGAFVELILWAEASATTIKYFVRRLDDLTIAPTTGSLSTDIPAAGTQLNPHFNINNNATAAQSVLAFGGLFMEAGI